jgi:4'-phosphopantetheinyl transferase
MIVLPQIFIFKRKTFLTRKRPQIVQRNLIASLIGSAPEKLVFGTNKYGRPFLKFPPIKNFNFNLSHSGDYLVIAINNYPIGVDIERIKPLDIKIATNCFTKQELGYLNSRRKNQLERFYQMWVLKESFLKATGRGLSYPLKKVNFKYDNNGKNLILRPKNVKGKWFFRIYEIDKNYKMAICSRKNKFPRNQFYV